MLVVNKTVSGSISAYTVTELTELTRYSVWLVAVNIRRTDKAKLTSRPSQVITFDTKGGANTAPQEIMSSQVTSTSALITWQQPLFSTPRSVRYYIRYFKSTRPDRNRFPQSTRERRFNLTNLDIYTNYTIDIAAYVNPLLSTYYASYNFTTKQAAPSPPQKVKANDIRSRSVSMSWTPPLRANGLVKKYRIYIQSDHTSRPNNLNNGNKTVSQSQRVETIGKLIPFTTYYVWVTAINVDGRELESDFERPTVFKTNAEGSSPPRQVQWFNVTSHSVIVSWRKPVIVHGNVEKYSVLLVSFLKQKTVKKLLAKKHENSLFLFVDNLVPHTQYTVTVQAGTRTTCCSTLLWSDHNTDEPTVTFTTQQTAPSRPARPNVTNVLSRSCLIKWKLPDSPNGDIQFYLLSLYKKADNTDPSISHKTSNIDTFRHPAKNSTLQMELFSLSPYTAYGAAVTAVNVMNNTELKSKQSELVNFTTADETPTAPSNCDIKKRNSTSIRVSWDTPYPFDYKVEFYKVKVNYAANKDVTAKLLTVYHQSVQLSKLRPYTMYDITVVAVTNNTIILEGPACYLQTRTTLPVPDIPSNCTATKTNLTSLLVKWNPYSSRDDAVAFYQLIFQSQFETKIVKTTQTRLQETNLTPDTNYNITISAFTNNTKLLSGPPCQLLARTGKNIHESKSTAAPLVVAVVLPCLLVIVIVVVAVYVVRHRKRCCNSHMLKNDAKDTETNACCYEMPSIAQTTRAIDDLDMTESNAYNSVTVETSEIASYADVGTTMMQSKVGSLTTSDDSIIYEEVNS
ncbi:phosphatidylinositol phosphatase PTPRQ-like [Corticium candelabrum]|uniref:phosphatidylinositol phosphatase PTPRQ-like n=1 Tax=Corticium candelabrum TaxID=121492 RepID=UPI002E25F731|nr:phosphatidylinositol phosphatase PTPRQ-like [Corticium candelabrum]